MTTTRLAQRDAIVSAAVDWHIARAANKACRAALLAYRREHGGCLLTDPNDYIPAVRPADPCYRIELPISEWCAVCLGSQPLWLACKGAATLARACTLRLAHLAAKEAKQA